MTEAAIPASQPRLQTAWSAVSWLTALTLSLSMNPLFTFRQLQGFRALCSDSTVIVYVLIRPW